ncbi:Bifunctional purine biosynthetic protein ADE5,7 [Lecanora helva]
MVLPLFEYCALRGGEFIDKTLLTGQLMALADIAAITPWSNNSPIFAHDPSPLYEIDPVCMAAKTRISVLASGNGTNFQALIDSVQAQNELKDCEIVHLIVNRKAAYARERARDAGIRESLHGVRLLGTMIVNDVPKHRLTVRKLLDYKKRFPESVEQARLEYDRDLAVKILNDEPSIVVCAGWMHILSPTFLDLLAAANVPVINLQTLQSPALPGAYNGAEAIERAHKDWLDGKIEQTGVMIHYVISEVDMGEPILIVPIPFQKGDEDIETLKERIHGIEHSAIVTGTKMAISRLPHMASQSKDRAS